MSLHDRIDQWVSDHPAQAVLYWIGVHFALFVLAFGLGLISARGGWAIVVLIVAFIVVFLQAIGGPAATAALVFGGQDKGKYVSWINGTIYLVFLGVAVIPATIPPLHLIGAICFAIIGWWAYGIREHNKVSRALMAPLAGVGVVISIIEIIYALLPQTMGVLNLNPGSVDSALAGQATKVDTMAFLGFVPGLLVWVAAIGALIWLARKNAAALIWGVIIIASLFVIGNEVKSIITPDSRIVASAEAATTGPSFDEPVILQAAEALPDGTYRVVLSANTFGWTTVQVPAGKYNISASGTYIWDSSTSDPQVGPNGAPWTPEEGVQRPEQFPMQNAPMASLLGKIGDNISFLGESTQIFTDSNGVVGFGINERWTKSAFADNNGLITIVLTPVR